MPGKALIQMDLRGKKGGGVIAIIDDNEEPPCIQVVLSGEAVTVEVKLDEAFTEELRVLLRLRREELIARRAYQRGASNALRRKR